MIHLFLSFSTFQLIGCTIFLFAMLSPYVRVALQIHAYLKFIGVNNSKPLKGSKSLSRKYLVKGPLFHLPISWVTVMVLTTRDYILIANFIGMTLLPFALLAILNFKLYTTIKVLIIFIVFMIDVLIVQTSYSSNKFSGKKFKIISSKSCINTLCMTKNIEGCKLTL